MPHYCLPLEHKDASARVYARFKRVGPLSVSVLLLLILVLTFSNARTILDSPLRTFILNTVFSSAIPFVVGVVAAWTRWGSG